MLAKLKDKGGCWWDSENEKFYHGNDKIYEVNEGDKNIQKALKTGILVKVETVMTESLEEPSEDLSEIEKALKTNDFLTVASLYKERTGDSAKYKKSDLIEKLKSYK